VSLLHSYWECQQSQSYDVIGKIKECHSYGNQYGSSSKKKKKKERTVKETKNSPT
jgi:hypothetical protein